VKENLPSPPDVAVAKPAPAATDGPQPGSTATHFYVSAIDPDTRKKHLVAGPYASWDEAKARQDDVRRHASDVQPLKADFMAWGTAGADRAIKTPLGENWQPESRRKPEERQGMVGSGDRFRTVSGRLMAPAPKIDATTNGKTHASIRRMNAWLLNEAKKEAAATGNDYLATLLSAINLKNISQSDTDTLNMVLFGDEMGPASNQRISA
jgi:hypothetical protein